MNKILESIHSLYQNAVRIAKRPDGVYRTTKENIAKNRINRKFELQYQYVDKQLRLFSGNEDQEAYMNVLIEMPEQEGIANLMYDHEFDLMNRGAVYTVNKNDLEKYNVNWDITSKQPSNWLQSRKDFELLDTFGLEGTFLSKTFEELNIHGSTQKQLYGLFEKTFNGQMSIPELRQTLKNDYVFTDRRADVLAYRGSAVAYAQGEGYVIEDFKQKNPTRFVMHRWITVGDKQVTAECRANEMQGWIMQNQAFKSGDMTYPRRSHPSVCRCSTATKILAPSDNPDQYLNKRDGDVVVPTKVGKNTFNINKRESQFLQSRNIPSKEVKNTFLAGRGGYDTVSKVITVDSKNYAYKNRTYLHEIGHAIDNNYNTDTRMLSKKKNGFEDLISDGRYKHGLSKEAVAVIQKRFDREPQSSYRIASEDVGDFLSGRPVKDLTGITRQASGFVRDYYRSPSEVFAESYMLYRTDPEFSGYAPKLNDYFDYITGLLDIAE